MIWLEDQNVYSPSVYFLTWMLVRRKCCVSLATWGRRHAPRSRTYGTLWSMSSVWGRSRAQRLIIKFQKIDMRKQQVVVDAPWKQEQEKKGRASEVRKRVEQQNFAPIHNCLVGETLAFQFPNAPSHSRFSHSPKIFQTLICTPFPTWGFPLCLWN